MMKLTKEDCIALRLLMFKLLQNNLTDTEIELVFKVQVIVTERLKELGEYSDEIILKSPVFVVKSPSLQSRRTYSTVIHRL